MKQHQPPIVVHCTGCRETWTSTARMLGRPCGEGRGGSVRLATPAEIAERYWDDER